MEKGKEKMKRRIKMAKKKKKLREDKKCCIDEINDKIKEIQKMEITEYLIHLKGKDVKKGKKN